MEFQENNNSDYSEKVYVCPCFSCDSDNSKLPFLFDYENKLMFTLMLLFAYKPI